MLVRATSADVERDPKNKWHVHIHVGAEVIKRALPNSDTGATDDALRAAAVETAKNEGYEVDPGKVAIVH